MKITLDHLVIGAADLDRGARYVKEHLGVDMPFGGKHSKMGTHNLLMRLSDTVFLEVIAIDPQADAPPSPRWFGLDDPSIRMRLEESPTLLCWVVNTDDITVALSSSEITFGEARPLSRGSLRWYFGVPDDGRLIAGGMLPYIMSWQTDTHPATQMADLGCSLNVMRIYTPFSAWTKQHLEDIGAQHLVEIRAVSGHSAPYLEAEILTPAGLVTLCGMTL